MRMLLLCRHILKICLIFLFCFICSIPGNAAYIGTPANSDEKTEHQPAFKQESSTTPDHTNPEIPEENVLILVTEIQEEDKLLSLPVFILPLRSISSDNNMEKIYQLALQYRSVSVTATNGAETWQEPLSVAWDFSSIDQTSVGEYAAVGRIMLPQGYAFGSNVLQEFKIPVCVEKQAPAVITSIEKWNRYTDAFALQQGSSHKELERIFSLSPHRLKCYAENGDSYIAVVEWDFSRIDLNTAGLYYAVGTLNAPEDTVFAEGLQFPEILVPVSIQAFGQPDINCLLIARGSLYFPWVMPPENLDNISVWLSENNGPWIRLEDEVYPETEMLLLSTHRLIPGSSYRLQVDYDGGQTGILSFTYADELILEGYHEGDRDGGDADGNPPNTIIQPPPEHSGQQNDGHTHTPSTGPSNPSATGSGETDSNPKETLRSDSGSNEQNVPEIKAPVSSSPSGEGTASSQPDEILTMSESDSVHKRQEQKKEPAQRENAVPTKNVDSQNPVFSEFFNETTDRISGIRLFIMLENGNQKAVFSKQGITLSIPKHALPDQIQNEDQIEVIIQAKPDGGFSFSFSINGTPLSSMPDISVMLPCPYQGTASTWYLLDENGVKIPAAGYNDTTKIASFQISHTGSYSMAEDDSAVLLTQPPDTKSSQPALRRFLPACLLFLSAGIFFLKKRRT